MLYHKTVCLQVVNTPDVQLLGVDDEMLSTGNLFDICFA